MSSIRPAVIVDGYAAGNFLPAAFGRLGIQVVHVQGSAELIGSLAAPVLGAYQDNIICAGKDDLEPTIRVLAACRPLAVLAGAEVGVPLADVLSERLGLATNGSALSFARRDKYLMIEAARAAGIRCARQFAAARPADIAAWARREDSYPVVVKPRCSSGADNVHICRNADEAQLAASAVLRARDLFGQPNAQALVQSYLDGAEYAVDTVSAGGQRHVCGVWRYEKKSAGTGRRVYHRNLLLDPRAAPVPELVDYTDAVLEALHIQHGPAHAEVILTPEGPTLVEVAARLNGGMNPAFQDHCLGANQADLTALAYARPEEFRRGFGGGMYRKRTEGVVYHASTRLDGVVESVDRQAVDRISALPTVHTVSLKLMAGQRIRPTVDLPSSPMRIYLAADDASRLRSDCAAIDELSELVYRLQPR